MSSSIFSMIGIFFPILSKKYKKKLILMSPRVIYTLWTTYPNHPLIVQKLILNVLYSAANFMINKPKVISSKQTAHKLNNDI